MNLIVTKNGRELKIELDVDDEFCYWMKDKPKLADEIQESKRVHDIEEFMINKKRFMKEIMELVKDIDAEEIEKKAIEGRKNKPFFKADECKAPLDPPKYCDVVNEMVNEIALNKYKSADYYQKDAMRTCSICDRKDDMLRHAVFGLTSEAGEVAGIMQKVYQGHEFDKEHMKKELGDCLWMIAEACEALDLSISEVMEANIDKLKARYPEGFDAEHSLHRAEGDI